MLDMFKARFCIDVAQPYCGCAGGGESMYEARNTSNQSNAADSEYFAHCGNSSRPIMLYKRRV
jgi:hypothetical protein